MMPILKKCIPCAVILAVLCGCAGCGIEPATKPDTIEDILNLKSSQEETRPETRTASLFSASESVTEYQSIFFGTETEPDTVQIETESESVTETEEMTEESTMMTETEPEASETTPPVVIPVASEWKAAYRDFLRDGGYLDTLSETTPEKELKFLLLYLDEDDIPELLLQTSSYVLLYTYENHKINYLHHFRTSRYSYEFYYRPYHNMIASLQGSVMADGTYWEIREYENKYRLSLRKKYCYPTRIYSYEIYQEQGMNIDLDKAPELDIWPEMKQMLGTSWIGIPDVFASDELISRYEITEENLDMLFEYPEDPTEETEA